MPVMPPAANLQMAPPPIEGPPSPSGTALGGGGGAIPRMVFSVVQALSALGKAVPQAAAEIEQARALIESVLAKAAGGQGSPEQEASPMRGMAPPGMGPY